MPASLRDFALSALLPLVAVCTGIASAHDASGGGSAMTDAAARSGGAVAVPYDWLISGGMVIDGSGAGARRADVLLRDGEIAFVGIVDADTLEVRDRFDARGRVVAPGFIDLHAHGDPLATPGFENFLAMGVTTIVLGLDGTSPRAGELAGHLAEVRRARPAVNVGYLVGHNTVRLESGVGYGRPEARGLGRMAGLVEQALDAGAFGLSLGLEYDPGVRAELDELVAIALPVAARGGVVMSHLRSEDSGQVGAALAELLEIGRRSGANVHASHLKVVLGNDPAEAADLLEAMAAARTEEVRATADVYPYIASYTGLAILFPEWARPPHDYERAVAQRRAELADHLRRRVETRNGPEATLFGTGRWAGRTLAEAAAEVGRPFEELLVELGPGGARAAYFVMDERVMTTLLRDPYVAVATDGGPALQHPRGFGSFPRVIRRYAHEQRLLPLEEAVRKMSGLPASILGIDAPAGGERPRGLLRPGWAADVVAFDPAELEDTADFQNPHRLARGMAAVWVNGVPASAHGPRAGASPNGLVLTR